MAQSPGLDHWVVPELGLENPSAPGIEDVVRNERQALLRQCLLEVLAELDKCVDGQGGFDGSNADWFSATVRMGMEADCAACGKRSARSALGQSFPDRRATLYQLKLMRHHSSATIQGTHPATSSARSAGPVSIKEQWATPQSERAGATSIT